MPETKRREIAESIQIIASGSKAQPNICIYDDGEGQHPTDFENTFLSLNKDNKLKIKFVQGKYNMGSTGAIPNCGEKKYQLIISRKHPQLLEGKEDMYGFSLVRLHKAAGTDIYKNSWYEYCILLSILKTGLKIGKGNEEFKFLDTRTKQMVTLWGYPVSCLADIPLKDLHIHAERYGRHAIGFHKESAINNNFHPVLYVNQYSSVFHRFIELRNQIEDFLNTTNKEFAGKLQEFLLLLGSIAKSGDLKANPVNDINWDQLQLNNFYYEREWRSVYDWNFNKKDVAIIIIPDEKISEFARDRKSNESKVDDTIPILPFSMIYRL